MTFKSPTQRILQARAPCPAPLVAGRGGRGRAKQSGPGGRTGRRRLCGPPALLSDRRGRRARFGAGAARSAPAGTAPPVLAPPVRHCAAPAAGRTRERGRGDGGASELGIETAAGCAGADPHPLRRRRALGRCSRPQRPARPRSASSVSAARSAGRCPPHPLPRACASARGTAAGSSRGLPAPCPRPGPARPAAAATVSLGLWYRQRGRCGVPGRAGGPWERLVRHEREAGWGAARRLRCRTGKGGMSGGVLRACRVRIVEPLAGCAAKGLCLTAACLQRDGTPPELRLILWGLTWCSRRCAEGPLVRVEGRRS